MRKMASIQIVQELKPIEGADLIEAARINGWWVIVKKNDYVVGQHCIYCEIDSFIPETIAPFLTKNKPKEYEGILGSVLKTVRLKGQIYQGLLLPINGYLNINEVCEGVFEISSKVNSEQITVEHELEDADVSSLLGIVKYESPVKGNLAGMQKGNFPSFIPKTDQERIQNIKSGKWLEYQTLRWEVTEKLEGSSMTIYYNQGVWGVCSRNVDLKLDQEGNAFVNMFNKLKNILDEALPYLAHIELLNFAIQGELVGPGIQGNIYNLTEHKFAVFDIYDINKGEYLAPSIRNHFMPQLGFYAVPLLSYSLVNLGTVQEELNKAEWTSVLNPYHQQEGVVYKSEDGKHSFKAINNAYLLKQKD